MTVPQGAGVCGAQDTHLLHGLLPFTFFKQLATPNVLRQRSQSVQGISGHAQRGSQRSKPKSLVPFDSMKKGPYLWKESPVPAHYRPKASSEPESCLGYSTLGIQASVPLQGPGTPPCRGGAAVQPGWSPASFKYARCLLGSRHYDACGPGGGPEPGSREQSTRARVDHCILSHSRCCATCGTLACSHRVSSWEIHRG